MSTARKILVSHALMKIFVRRVREKVPKPVWFTSLTSLGSRLIRPQATFKQHSTATFGSAFSVEHIFRRNTSSLSIVQAIPSVRGWFEVFSGFTDTVGRVPSRHEWSISSSLGCSGSIPVIDTSSPCICLFENYDAAARSP